MGGRFFGFARLYALALTALLLSGCTGTTATESNNIAKVRPTEALSVLGPQPTAIAMPPTPVPTSTPVPPTPEPTATPIPEPTASPTFPPTTTPIPEPTLPASAEGPSVAAPPRSATTPLPYRPQPMPLHPFQPAGERARVVVLDPGHGGPEVGSAGAGVAEKNVNWNIAIGVRQLLEADGIKVVLTRDGDRRASSLLDEGNSSARQDLQARMDLANQVQADVYISIHNNGSGDPDQSGTEVWWDGKRPFAAYNKALAEETLQALLAAIRGVGYPTRNRGLKEDSHFRTYRGYTFPLFVLGPPRSGSSSTRATQMTAILGETLFLSNPYEAQMLRRDDVISAIARGYYEGLLRYFQRIDSGQLAIPPGGLPPEVPNHYDLSPAGGNPTPQ